MGGCFPWLQHGRVCVAQKAVEKRDRGRSRVGVCQGNGGLESILEGREGEGEQPPLAQTHLLAGTGARRQSTRVPAGALAGRSLQQAGAWVGG